MFIVLTFVTQFILRYVSSGLNPGDKFNYSPGIMQRIYNIESEKDGDDGQIFTMSSHLEDDFGEVVLLTSAHISGPGIAQRVITQGFVSMDVRLREMYHFLSVLKLFDPQFNTRKDVQEIVSETAPPFPQD